MARGTTKDGFHIDDIVNTEPIHGIPTRKQSETEERAILTGPRPQKRVQKLIYLTVSQKRLLAKYGKRIGKANGGASRIVEDALSEYFMTHPLEK
ncbi:hypothetical protein Lpp219_16057 [Lacticaseibacillus paracasei subsp. paracasei Lpp219]|nr:hypothetical protein Lpp219_16057 [Lacticaseibacillus paracasei subsp. paracasei Lpp219]